MTIRPFCVVYTQNNALSLFYEHGTTLWLSFMFTIFVMLIDISNGNKTWYKTYSIEKKIIRGKTKFAVQADNYSIINICEL